MAEFLMVVPEGWLEIPNPESIVGEESWNTGNPWELTEWLKGAGYVQEGFAVLDHRVFRDAGVVRLWVLIGPEQ